MATTIESLIKYHESINKDLLSCLNGTQLMVIEQVAEGKTNKQIAEDLNTSKNVIAVHVRNILLKLNAENRIHVASIYKKATGNG